jgi:hypothetical protein
MRWKEDLIELHNNLLFDHGTSLILDENSSQQQHFVDDGDPIAQFFFSSKLHTYCLNKQIFPKTLVFKT